MLWHVVTVELGTVSDQVRLDLEAKIDQLREIEEIRWFQSGRDVERPGNTAFISVLVDRAALERYRAHPIHLQLAQALRDSHVVVHRLDLDNLPAPS
jgi:hypothetical protein